MPAEAVSTEVRDNPARHRYELVVDGVTAFVTYECQPGRVVLVHTEVPEALAGKGVGSRLARGALDSIRALGMKIVPQCSFIARFVEKHPEYRDLLAG